MQTGVTSQTDRQTRSIQPNGEDAVILCEMLA